MRLFQPFEAGIVAALALLPIEATAYCACACIDGKAQNICSNSTDLEVYCARLCPINVLPPGSPQRSPDLERFVEDTGKGSPQDKLFIGGR